MKAKVGREYRQVEFTLLVNSSRELNRNNQHWH